jgi:hypothetical protein
MISEEQREYNKKYYQENKEYNKQYREEHSLLFVYKDIKTRCYSTKCKAFKNYGGRGIVMCQEWLNSFEAFEKWALNNNYRKGLQIDRIDNDGNYEPNNCQFITPAENTAIGKRRKHTNNTSGYIGVVYYKRSGKWQAKIVINKKRIYLGSFDTPEGALLARTQAEIEYFGKQMTNFSTTV